MENDYSIFRGYGVPITLKSPDDFLKVCETLTRIGILSRKTKTLFQSCHILHKQGLFSILHFKELFALDGKPSDFTDEDKGRRNTITQLLSEWGLVEIVTPEQVKEPVTPLTFIKIISFAEKGNYELIPKYSIGSRNKNKPY